MDEGVRNELNTERPRLEIESEELPLLNQLVKAAKAPECDRDSDDESEDDEGGQASVVNTDEIISNPIVITDENAGPSAPKPTPDSNSMQSPTKKRTKTVVNISPPESPVIRTKNAERAQNGKGLKRASSLQGKISSSFETKS